MNDIPKSDLLRFVERAFKLAQQVVDSGAIEIWTGDKGYDDQNHRPLAREHEVRPLIKHREFTLLHEAWNARLDNNLYHRRNMNETVAAVIKQKFGAFVRSRVWWKQFRERHRITVILTGAGCWIQSLYAAETLSSILSSKRLLSDYRSRRLILIERRRADSNPLSR